MSMRITATVCRMPSPRTSASSPCRFTRRDAGLTPAWSVRGGGRGPSTGGVADGAGGSARNLPVPPGFHDSEMAFLMEEVVLPIGARLRPEAIVLQCGADGLADDPMSGLGLSNRALWG